MPRLQLTAVVFKNYPDLPEVAKLTAIYISKQHHGDVGYSLILPDEADQSDLCGITFKTKKELLDLKEIVNEFFGDIDVVHWENRSFPNNNFTAEEQKQYEDDLYFFNLAARDVTGG